MLPKLSCVAALSVGFAYLFMPTGQQIGDEKSLFDVLRVASAVDSVKDTFVL
jgi:hypothetical protein